MKKIIRLRESELTKIVKLIISEIENQKEIPTNDIKLCSEMGIKEVGFCNSNGKKVRFGPCAKLEIKSPGMCEFTTKRPVEFCPNLGVNINAICYISDNEILPNTEKNNK
jgi:hypothetical protein